MHNMIHNYVTNARPVNFKDYVCEQHVHVSVNMCHMHCDNFREKITNHTSTRVLYECQLVYKFVVGHIHY